MSHISSFLLLRSNSPTKIALISIKPAIWAWWDARAKACRWWRILEKMIEWSAPAPQLSYKLLLYSFTSRLLAKRGLFFWVKTPRLLFPEWIVSHGRCCCGGGVFLPVAIWCLTTLDCTQTLASALTLLHFFWTVLCVLLKLCVLQRAIHPLLLQTFLVENLNLKDISKTCFWRFYLLIPAWPHFLFFFHTHLDD